MDRSPEVSVVTPSYNQARFIEDTMESVANQQHDNVEHIVVDGESDDGTVDLLRDSGVTWISEPDDGQADAINKGFEMASGDIVGWLNSDDVFYDVQVLHRVAEYFANTDADVVFGDMALIDEISTVVKYHCVPRFDFEKLVRYCFVVQPSVFFRSNVVDEHRLDTDLEYVMDYEFWLRLGRTYEFRKVDDVLSGDRNHPQRKILHDRVEMLQEAEEVAQQYGRPDGWRLWTERKTDAILSGFPRRVEAMVRTIRHHSDTPQLAFDGELAPLSTMLGNVWRSNKDLV